jgi:hypothetical protein
LIGLHTLIEQSLLSRAGGHLEANWAPSYTVTLVRIGLLSTAPQLTLLPTHFAHCNSTSFPPSDSLPTLLPSLRIFLYFLFCSFLSFSSVSIYACFVSCLLIFNVLPYFILNHFV